MDILIVDDCSIITSIVKKVLGKRKDVDEIFEAENGEVALEILNANPNIKLLITDWNMPVMNGLEFVERIRANNKFSKLYIIMVTSESSKIHIIQAIKAGVDNYIIKPFTINSLKDKLDVIFTNACLIKN